VLNQKVMSSDMGALVCIDNEDVENFLTVGKIYVGQDNDGQFVTILDDTHGANTYVVERFERR